MSIVIFLGLIIVSISLLLVIVSRPIATTEVNIFLDETSVSKMTIAADYVGGLNTVLEKTKCTLILMKDKINIRITFKNVDLLIPFSNISKIDILEAKDLDAALSAKIYIPKKYKNNTLNYFLVVKYTNPENLNEETLILECKYHEEFMTEYNKLFNNWFNEYRKAIDDNEIDYDDIDVKIFS